MFTNEHLFDASVITLMDEGDAPLREDVIVTAFEDCVTIEQYDPRLKETRRIDLSLGQVKDLFAAIDLPEGIYRLRRDAPNR